MKRDCYFSVDIESSGPIPHKYSMLSLGACVIENLEKIFYAEFQPTSLDFVPDALKVSGFDLEKLRREGELPQAAMKRFKDWIESCAGDGKPVFVGFNAAYDWQFVNWYFHSFLGVNPFGFAALDIKSYFM